jgi:hypothetical protein
VLPATLVLQIKITKRQRSGLLVVFGLGFL